MCGITGFVSLNRPRSLHGYYDAHRLIAHRGPDDEGFVVDDGRSCRPLRGDDSIAHFDALAPLASIADAECVLGHRRLAIIDLTHQGHQPFSDSTGRYWLAYNGELYNYLELRAELVTLGHEFHTDSDTEVVLHAIIEWGNEAYGRFNGMWSTALWDSRERTLQLCRDRFGIKPLYLSRADGAVWFASELRFLLALAPIAATPDAVAIDDYLRRSWLSHSERTMVSGIEELPPGHSLTITADGERMHRYWTFEPHPVRRSAEEALDEFAAIFEDSLRLRMRADVEVGTLLSGGLDSSLIVGGLHRLGLIGEHGFKAFSADFDDVRFSERRFADLVAGRVGAEQHIIKPSWDELAGGGLDALIDTIEEPFRSLSVHSQNRIYRAVRAETGVTVLLNGQGADELFGGYTRHYWQHIAALLRKGRVPSAIREARVFSAERDVASKALLSGVWRKYKEALRTPDYFNRVTFGEVTHSALREYLRYDDRNSMAYSLEARVPFLDYRLVEFAFTLDDRFKIDDRENKLIERRYARGIVPDEVVDRTDKMGFVSPQEVWQRTVMRADLEAALPGMEASPVLGALAGRDGYLDRYRSYLAGTSNDWAFAWRMYCLSRWATLRGFA